MKRRKFLKSIGISAAFVAVAPVAAGKIVEHTPQVAGKVSKILDINGNALFRCGLYLDKNREAFMAINDHELVPISDELEAQVPEGPFVLLATAFSEDHA